MAKFSPEERLRFAEKAGVKVEEFLLTSPRYLKQYGDDEPVLLQASPGSPVSVVLEVGTVELKDKKGQIVKREKVVPGPGLEKVAPKIKDALYPRGPVKGGGKSAADVHSKPVEDGKRAADK